MIGGTGSRGNLIGLTAIAALLALAVGLDPGAGGPRRVDGALVVDARRATIRTIVLAHGDGERDELVLGGDGVWGLSARLPGLATPVRAPVDAAAIADLTGTLELLAWRRRLADPGVATATDTPRLVITVDAGAATTVLRLGAAVAATDQAWMTRDGDRWSYLIDGAAARALDRRAADLRVQRPLALRGREVTGLEIHAGPQSLILAGRPLAVHPRDLPGAVRADAGAAAALLAMIDRLELTRFADGAAPSTERGVTVRVIDDAGAAELAEVGACPGHPGERLVDTPAGTGCLAEADVAALVVAAGMGTELYDHHLLAGDAGDPRSIAIGGDRGITLTARGGGWSDAAGAELDGDAVRDWAIHLDRAADGDAAPVSGDDRFTELGRIVVDYGGGRSDRLLLLRGRGGDDRIRRDDEPVSFAVTRPGLAEALFRPLLYPFLPRARWQEEPSAVRLLSRRHDDREAERLERGQPDRPLEDWSVSVPAGAHLRAGVIDPLVEAAARLVARAVVADRAAPVHGLASPRAEIDVALVDPTGTARFFHSIDIGAPADGGGCYATGDRQPAVLLLDAATCATLLGPWTEP